MLAHLDIKHCPIPTISRPSHWAFLLCSRQVCFFHCCDGSLIDSLAEKLVRDGIIWSHLAGDTSQRLKAVRRIVRR